MKNKIFNVLLGVVVAVPMIAWAQTGMTASEYIQVLMAKIASLQQQLAELQKTSQSPVEMPVSSAFCYNWNSNLGIGATGQDVNMLKAAIIKEGYDLDQSFVYDEQTAAGVSAFQLKYKNEILTANGLTQPTGYLGRATRAKLNALYSCTTPPPPPSSYLKITGISGPTDIIVGATGTWTVKVSSAGSSNLSYSVDWGEPQPALNCNDCSGRIPDMQSNASFTHVYNSEGTYNPRFTVTDLSGRSVSATISVDVKRNPPPLPIVLSPVITSVFPDSVSNTSAANIYLYGRNFPIYFNLVVDGDRYLIKNITYHGAGLIKFVVPAGLAAGQHSVSIEGKTSLVSGIVSQSNVAYFTVTAPESSVTVTSPNGGEIWNFYSSRTIQWKDSAYLPCLDSTNINVPCKPMEYTYDIILKGENSCSEYNVTDRLVCTNGYPVYTIATGVSQTSYFWTIGNEGLPTNAIGRYKVEVCRSGTQVCDSSDRSFDIIRKETYR